MLVWMASLNRLVNELVFFLYHLPKLICAFLKAAWISGSLDAAMATAIVAAAKLTKLIFRLVFITFR